MHILQGRVDEPLNEDGIYKAPKLRKEVKEGIKQI